LAENEPSDLGKAVQEVSEKLQLLVSEEIALAKAEMSQKVSRLARGVAVGVAAGIFILAGLIYFLHGLSWLIWKLLDDGGTSYFIGFLIVAGVLFLVAALAGLMAARFIRRGTPPKPAMAIEEAQLIRETLKTPQPGAPTGAVVPREGAEVTR
jgi:Putative Actinobacterial Holin-X, holin superfamily III